MTKPEFSVSQILAIMTKPEKMWFWRDDSIPIRYTYWQQLAEEEKPWESDWFFNAFTEIQIEATEKILDIFRDVSGLDFTEIADNGHRATPWDMDDRQKDWKIQFANSSKDISYAAASTSTSVIGGDTGSLYEAVVVVYGDLLPTDYRYGSYNFFALLHEVGHALGLQHLADYLADSTYDNTAEFFSDSRQYSVMSFFSELNTGADFQGESAETLMLYDIAAIQSLYGRNMSTRSSDTVYGFNSNTNTYTYDFVQNSRPVFCIWDGSGIDMIDASGFRQDQIVDLNGGSFSNIGGLTGNVSIAFDCDIENAAGGSGNDLIMGNDLDNRVVGNEGNDTLVALLGDDHIEGGQGWDVAIFGSDRVNFIAQRNAQGGIDVLGPDGNDTLNDVEILRFADGDYVWDNSAGDLIPAGTFWLYAPTGFAGAIGGTGRVLGSAGLQDIGITFGQGAITFDATFNRGGDIIRIEGNAADYSVARSGSGVILTGPNASCQIPFGNSGLSLIFDDGVRTLVYDGVNVKIGNQTVSEAAPITAPVEGPDLPVGVDPNATGRIYIAQGAEVTVGGKYSIFGTNSAEKVIYQSGDVALDATFNRGGDVLSLPNTAENYQASFSGSTVFLKSNDGTVSIPIGANGLVIDFPRHDDRILYLDVSSGQYLIGGEIINSIPQTLGSFA